MEKNYSQFQKKIKALHDKINQQEKEIYQLKSLLDSIPGDIYWKDIKGIWAYLNKRCFQSIQHMGFAIDYQQILGKTDYQIFKEETADIYRKNDLDVIKNKVEIQKEEVTTLPSGEEVILLSIKKPFLNKNGKVLGVIGNTIDITHLKKIETELKKSKEQAESASLAKTEFIANMSHDIRTPLSGVVGMSELLEEIAASEEQRQYAGAINQCAEQLLGLLNGILDFVSARNVDENDIRLETFDLRKCLQSLIELERPSTTLKGLGLNLSIDEQAPRCLISDRTKIHRILLNLLGNAIKFTKEGGVTIKVDVKSILQDKATLRFAVIDTGIGIAKDKLKKVFERFYRVDPSYKGVYTGHGLGLNIAQAYAKLLGGEIKVASEEGKGTTFYFDLTCDIGKAKIASSSKEKPGTTNVLAQALQPKVENAARVLLVEDNGIALQMAQTFASRVGLQFLSAMDGTTALELAKSKDFDLIITDIGLPDISGLQFTRLYREWEMEKNKKPIPIIGLTAHVHEEAKEECLQVGMNEVFSKPVNLSKMKAMQQFIKPIAKRENPVKKQKNKTVSSSLGIDLPAKEEDLFALDEFALLDIQSGIQNTGNEALLKQMLSLIDEQELPKDIEEMEKAYALKDWEALENVAHKIKGGAVYIGTIRMKFACQYLERYIKAGHSKLIKPLYNQLIQVVQDTREKISSYLLQNNPE